MNQFIYQPKYCIKNFTATTTIQTQFLTIFKIILVNEKKILNINWETNKRFL